MNNKLCVILYYENNYNSLTNYYKYNLIKVLIVNCNIIPKNRLSNWLKFYSSANSVILNSYCIEYLEKLYNSNLEFIINLIKILNMAYPKNYIVNINDINTYLYKNNKTNKLNEIVNVLFTEKHINIISTIKLLFNQKKEVSILIRIIQDKLISIINNQLYKAKNITNIKYNLYFNNKKIKNIINILYNMELDAKYYKNKLFFINIIKLVILVHKTILLDK
ncbi:MAG: hypothetical protein N4P89_00775 [Candidatus Lightella neohaematopini]|nr:hypothetical protein [Candidatus Lightella neohaematopini]MCV2528706.1 hypothetical protein [Candidatus Lightella neohaematopini]